MAISIRTASDSDLEGADVVLQSAFRRSESWLRDLRLIRKLQPDGIFLACQREIPAGVVAAMKYSTFAHVGPMGVRQEFQGQRIGLALMQHLLAWLDEENMSRVRLDASPMGQPLYEKLGFIPCDPVCVFQRRNGQPTCQSPPETRLLSHQDLDLISVTDTQAFGADRSRVLRALLETYPERAFVLQDGQEQINGYLIAQEKRIGPWVMQETAEAASLLGAALSLPFGSAVSVAVPGENAHAIALLQHFGFEIVRVNRHMMRGPGAPAGSRGRIFGQASLSLG